MSVSSDEITKWIEQLKKTQEIRELTYAQIKGILQGAQLTTLNPTDKDMLTLAGLIFDYAKITGDTINEIQQTIVVLFRRIEILEQETITLKNSTKVSNPHSIEIV